METLTNVLDDLSHAVTQWLRSTFPYHQKLMRDLREDAGFTKFLPPPQAVPGTQGGAVDWWLRFLIDPAMTDVHVAVGGFLKLRGHPGHNAIAEALDNVFPASGSPPQSQVPGRFTTCDIETQARVCYLLSLLSEIHCAPVKSSKLLSLDASSTATDALALASNEEVADLIVMRDAAESYLIPRLPSGTVHCGPPLEGNCDLRAEPDLIVGDLLLELKATKGGKPRTDGSRTIRIERTDIDQVLGYLLLDFSDHYAIRQVGFYAFRFASLTTWHADAILTEMAGHPTVLKHARAEFRNMLAGLAKAEARQHRS